MVQHHLHILTKATKTSILSWIRCILNSFEIHLGAALGEIGSAKNLIAGPAVTKLSM